MNDTVKRFLRRLRSAPTSSQPVEITLYSRPGCHLCDDARALLHRLERRYPMRVTEVDITRDPALLRKYDIVIPVLELRGAHLEAPIREEAVIRALEARGQE